MPRMKTSKAQRRASEKWKKKNEGKNRYINERSSTRSFIRNKATHEDLYKLKELIETQLSRVLQEQQSKLDH